MVKKGTHCGSDKDGGAVGAETSTRATAPRRQAPRGVGTRWRQSPSVTPRWSPSLRARQSPSAIALFLSKKGKGKHVRREAARLPRAWSVSNALTLGELRRITKDFSDDQLIGQGAFGKVYKGVLTNGDVIAVKRFASTITGLQDGQYENEAQHLMRLKHPNIVQLVGYCSETEMKLVWHNGTFVRAEETERLLCLEYMQKKSLRDHLSDETSGLEWETRYKIIEGICYGLQYLHEEWHVTPIIHMDLKPANILLDKNMVPKIADFGLSRLFGEEQTRTYTKNYKGTPGYMAPEYLEKGVITKMFDIFSLGVIIIEIITGLKDYPTDETETYIERVLNNWGHRLTKAQGYTSQDIDYQQIKKCIQIGLLCVKFDWVKRPTINQIIMMLERSDEAYQNERECFRLVATQERIAANGSNTNMRLCFLNGLEPPVYTDENLTSQNHAAIKLAMFEGDKVVKSGALSKAKIEILVLRGDFSNKCQDNWTEDEFDKHIMQGRDGDDLVLGTVWLTNGMVELSHIRFWEGSCRKNVIMAARVCKSIKTSGRVQEAIMKPVKVLDRRNKPNEKRHPPRLDDELYRLEEIAKYGAYQKRLKKAQIHEVEGFLKALNENPNKLRAILKMENQQNAWLKLTKHARECVLKDRQELKGYHSKEGNVVLFFNYVHELVGAAFPQEYVACQRFNTAQKALVNKWRWHAYEKLKDISPDFAIKGNIPEPISPSTDVAAAPSVLEDRQELKRIHIIEGNAVPLFNGSVHELVGAAFPHEYGACQSLNTAQTQRVHAEPMMKGRSPWPPTPGPALRQLLSEAAVAIADGQYDAAATHLAALKRAANQQGDAEQRLIAMMVVALSSRIDPAAWHGSAPAQQHIAELCSVDQRAGSQLLQDISPCFRVAIHAASVAIVEAVGDHRAIHLVDFDVSLSQHAALIQYLADRRVQGRSLKVTAVIDPSSPFSQSQTASLHGIATRLQKLAERAGLVYRFTAVRCRAEELDASRLCCEPGEAVAVNLAFALSHVPDESVSPANPRDELLRRVRALGTQVVTLVEQELNTNTALLAARFTDACAHYGAILESLDATLGLEPAQKARAEAALTKKAANAVGRDGPVRLERCEVFGKWCARFGMAGFRPVSLGSGFFGARVGPVPAGFTVEANGVLRFCWMGRVVTVASAWR